MMQRKNLLLAGALSGALLALPLAGTGHAADTGYGAKTQSATDPAWRSDDAKVDHQDMTRQQRAQAQRDNKAAKADEQYDKRLDTAQDKAAKADDQRDKKVDKAQDKAAKAADRRDKKLDKAQDQYERKTGTTGRTSSGSGSSATMTAPSGAGSSDLTARPSVNSDARLGNGTLDNNRVTR
jgi:hypothetical protein